MSYSTLATGKWHCYRSENEDLPRLERKNPKNALFVINGVRTFSFQDIKLKGVESCIAEVRRIIADGRLGRVYREAFGDVDSQYFTENDFGLLASYFDQFLKEIHRLTHPKITQPIATTPADKKKQLNQKKVDLKKQIAEMQRELEETEKEADSIDMEAIDSDIAGEESFEKAPEVPTR